MTLVLPIMTLLLIALGAFCLFISMDNRSRASFGHADRGHANGRRYAGILQRETVKAEK